MKIQNLHTGFNIKKYMYTELIHFALTAKFKYMVLYIILYMSAAIMMLKCT